MVSVGINGFLHSELGLGLILGFVDLGLGFCNESG